MWSTDGALMHCSLIGGLGLDVVATTWLVFRATYRLQEGMGTGALSAAIRALFCWHALSMMRNATIAGLTVEADRKATKNPHLSVLPPSGRVRVARPRLVTDDAVRPHVMQNRAFVGGGEKHSGTDELKKRMQINLSKFLERKRHGTNG